MPKNSDIKILHQNLEERDRKNIRYCFDIISGKTGGSEISHVSHSEKNAKGATLFADCLAIAMKNKHEYIEVSIFQSKESTEPISKSRIVLKTKPKEKKEEKALNGIEQNALKEEIINYTGGLSGIIENEKNKIENKTEIETLRKEKEELEAKIGRYKKKLSFFFNENQHLKEQQESHEKEIKSMSSRMEIGSLLSEAFMTKGIGMIKNVPAVAGFLGMQPEQPQTENTDNETKEMADKLYQFLLTQPKKQAIMLHNIVVWASEPTKLKTTYDLLNPENTERQKEAK